MISIFQLDDIRHSIHPGALVLFTGLSIYSLSVESLTRSKYSHCAIVVYPNKNGKTVITEASGKGVCLSNLDDYVTGDYQSIYIINIGFTVSSEDILSIYSKYAMKPYSYNPLNLLSAVFKKELATVTYESFFCSEYVIVILKELSIYIPLKEVNEYSPQDVSMLEIYDGLMINVEVPPISFFRRIYEFFKLY
jgi:hypothetical protein